MEAGKDWSDKVKLGDYTLKNRIVLAALTRQRCEIETGIPTQLHQLYYTQRSGAGLMLTQCVAWCQRGESFPGAAGLYTRQQMEGWKPVIDAVHKKGAFFFVQIFHGGRSALKETTRGLKPQAPSSIAIRDMNFFLQKQYEVPEEMTLEAIELNKKLFRNCVELAKQAGFDGIQLHGANGYLIEEFFKSWSNKRSDKYGGSAENRCRFALELVDIALQFFKPWQIGIKISPCSRHLDIYDDNPVETYTYLTKELNKKKIGFIEVREWNYSPYQTQQKFPKTPKEQMPNACKEIRPHFDGLIIGNDSFTSITGIEKIRLGECDLISFGKSYVCNPDLAERILLKQEISNTMNIKTAFRGPQGKNFGATGYTDYPTYDEIQKNKKLQKEVQKK